MSKKPRRFTEVIDMLTSIEKDDSGGKRRRRVRLSTMVLR